LQNLLGLWSSLSVKRQIIVIAATIGMFLAVMGVARLSNTPGMSLLYAGLDGAAAGDVVAALDQRGVTYEIRGESIYVDDAQRDILRMTLAAEGLPAAGGQGYELLDSLSGFGTTSQMFDAAYWRAKEGELARTILTSPQLRAARVHIAQAPSAPFQRDQKPTASVTITTAGGTVTAEQAQALRHLVAAAVPGMLAGDVALIDSVAGLITTGGDQTMGQDADARAMALRHNVERLLEARVGPGKAMVEVSVDVVTEREEINETVFDPASRVAISSETAEKTGSNSQADGAVTVASNLPEGDAGAGPQEKSESSETTERLNYEVSETKRAVVREPGAIRKLSVAVLVDDVTVTAADGTVSVQPRTPEELAILRELVASAVGLDETRGDVLTLKSLTFQPPAILGTDGGGSAAPLLSIGMILQLVQVAVLAVVALVLGLFVIRPILSGNTRKPLELTAIAPPLALPPVAGSPQRPALTGEIDDGFAPAGFGASQALLQDGEDVPDPVTRLRRLIEERQTESIEILRSWMEQEEEKA
jgi:flagellar M-ring protein FliF